MGERNDWKRFFVVHPGGTNEAYLAIAEIFKSFGQTEVMSPEECDYSLVFCPVVSRIGVDIEEALDCAPSGKPVILVVMHHTFSKDHVVVESRRQVTDANVRLTVDCLFYEDRLLECNHNDIMKHEIQRFLGVPFYQRTGVQRSGLDQSCILPTWGWIAIGVAVLLLIILIVILIVI
ncbi:uncharacterized protein KZ484_013830 [Pholidichthys leucotaenia]